MMLEKPAIRLADLVGARSTDGAVASATDIAAPHHHQIHDQLTNTFWMQVRTCPVWNWYGIVEFHLRLQFYSIPFLGETPSLAFST